jgi:cyclophilin family peptidyl-prolyl cis-trans isomerase
MVILAFALAQPAPHASALKTDTVKPKLVPWLTVQVKGYGKIVMELFPDVAPQNAANVESLARKGFYDGLTFHRVVPGFVIQGGDPKGDGSGGLNYTVPAEIKLKHYRGSVAMARLGDAGNPSKASSSCQFYICLQDLPMLDGNYTVIGQVRSGMEVVDKIAAVERDAADKPITPVVMEKVYVEEAEPTGAQAASPATSSRPQEQEKASTPQRPKLPPKLQIALSFEETGKKNSTLDAGEQTYIVATVENTGKGDAMNLKVIAEAISSMSGVDLTREIKIDRIASGDSEIVRIPMKARDDVLDQELRVRVSVTEPVFGMDALPNVINVTSKKLEPPDLVVSDMAIDDGESEWAQGNSDKQLEPGEQVEITQVLQNRGTGDALDVAVEVTTTGENVLFQGDRNPLTPGDIAPGDYRLLEYPILVNTRYRGDKVTLVLNVREKRNRFSKTDTVVIPLNTKIAAPAEIVVTPRTTKTQIAERTPPRLTDSLLFGIPKGPENPDAYAVVIGVQNYRDISRVDYARSDAEAVRQYLIQTFGVLDGNIIMLLDPTKTDIERVFGSGGQLQNYVKPGKSDVFIYYAGHGAPSVKNKKGYLVPFDAKTDYIELDGYPLESFYASLKQIPARRVFVAIDACFSGETPDPTGKVQTLLANASPLVVTTIPEETPSNALVFTAASGSQLACWYPEMKHSLFTYWLLKGLKGDANENGDNSITLGELKQYLETNVPPVARSLYNREQTPEVKGDMNAEIRRIR